MRPRNTDQEKIYLSDNYRPIGIAAVKAAVLSKNNVQISINSAMRLERFLIPEFQPET